MAARTDPDTTLELTREFKAGREQVFSAFLDAAVLQAIWSGEAYKIVEMTVDPRVGGGWKLAMRDEASGSIGHCSARFAEIERPSRIVWFTKWLDGPLAAAPEARVTLEFIALEGGSRLKLTHEFFPDRQTRDHHGQGWGSGLERLGRFLAGELQPDREYMITRSFDAPRTLVFQAWTDPKHLARWWGPAAFSNQVSMDVRPGGAYRIVMRSPDGSEYPIKGVFREIEEPARLVMTMDCSEHSAAWHDMVKPNRGKDERNPAGTMLMTATFDEIGTRTTLTIRVRFESSEICDSMKKLGMNEGWSQSLVRLADVLARR